MNEPTTSILDRLPKDVIQHMKSFQPVYEPATLYVTLDDRKPNVSVEDSVILAQLMPGDRIMIRHKIMRRNKEYEYSTIVIKNDIKLLAKCIDLYIKEDGNCGLCYFEFIKSSAVNIDTCDLAQTETMSGQINVFIYNDDCKYDINEIQSVCDMFGSIYVES